jgi:cysteine-rich repeat protein
MYKYSSAVCFLLACEGNPVEGTSAAMEAETTTMSSTSAATGEQTSTSGDPGPATMTTSASEPATSTSTGATSPDTGEEQTTSGSTGTNPATCGDGIVGPDEECDDGATADGDGCSALCKKELRRVFVTSAVFTGDLGGPAGADAKCQAAAESAAAPGMFRAWLSTDVASPANDFVQSEVPYVRLDGVQVAANWQDLVDGTLEAPISVSELGGLPAPSTHACIPADALGAWTGTSAAGVSLMTGTCDNWSSTTGDATLGRVGDPSMAWSSFCPTPCSSQAALYCVEQ